VRQPENSNATHQSWTICLCWKFFARQSQRSSSSTRPRALQLFSTQQEIPDQCPATVVVCVGKRRRQQTSFGIHQGIACEATSSSDVELRVEALLHGNFLFALPLFVGLSRMLALGTRAEEYRIVLHRLRNLAYHHHSVLFLPLFENEVEP
jgi:hypothetical protein